MGIEQAGGKANPQAESLAHIHTHTLLNQNKTTDAKKQEKTEEKNEEKMITRLLNFKKGGKAKTDILRASIDIRSDMAEQKMMASKQMEKAILQEMKSILGTQQMQDAVQLSGAAVKKEQDKKTDQKKEIVHREKQGIFQEREGGQRMQEMERQNRQKAFEKTTERRTEERKGEAQKEVVKQQTTSLKEYAQSMAKYFLSQSNQEKRNMDRIKQDLKEQGVSNQKLTHMHERVGNLVRQQVMMGLKHTLLKKWFSDERSLGQLFSEREHVGLLQKAAQNKGLGGEDFGNYKGGLGEALGDEANTMRKQLIDFVFHEVESAAIYQHVNEDDASFMKTAKQLESLSKTAVLNYSIADVIKKMNRTIENVGLTHFIPPDAMEQSFSFMEGDERRKKESPTFYLDEEDMLTDQLRHLLMLKALNPGIGSRLKLMFQAAGVKRSLHQLVGWTDEKENQIQKEAVFLARFQLREKLRNLFTEQASLIQLKGPNFDHIKTQKEVLLNAMEHLGCAMSQAQLDQLRDDVNREMFPVIKEELHRVDIQEDIRQNMHKNQKRKHLIQVLNRLKAETHIIDDIGAKEGDPPLLGNEVVESA